MTRSIILLLPAILARAPAGDTGDAEKSVERALRALGEGRAREAVTILEALAASEGFSTLPAGLRAEVRAALGLGLESLQDPEQAAAALEEALVDGDSLPPELREEAAMALARSALEMKDGAGARRALGRLGDEGSLPPSAALLLAASRVLEGDPRAAEAIYERARRERPSAEAAFQLGVIRFDRGEIGAALDLFQDALRLEPGVYYAEVYRARALLELDRAGEALLALERLREAHGTPEVLLLLGNARLRGGRLEEAARAFEEALAAAPRLAEALFGLGTALRKLGKMDEARRALERFHALHRDEASRLRRADSLSQAILRNPDDAALAGEMAQFALEGGDLESAERHGWRAVRLDPSRAAFRLTLARALAGAGRFGSAALQYQRLLRLEPGDAAARRELEDLVRKHARSPGDTPGK